jgi:pyridoxine 4-dehydrogenase
MQVALAWLLHRSPNILLIPGTSSVEYLRENLSAASLQLAPETITQLDSKQRCYRSADLLAFSMVLRI